LARFSGEKSPPRRWAKHATCLRLRISIPEHLSMPSLSPNALLGVSLTCPVPTWDSWRKCKKWRTNSCRNNIRMPIEQAITFFAFIFRLLIVSTTCIYTFWHQLPKWERTIDSSCIRLGHVGVPVLEPSWSDYGRANQRFPTNDPPARRHFGICISPGPVSVRALCT
jgi:hypothetical protein